MLLLEPVTRNVSLVLQLQSLYIFPRGLDFMNYVRMKRIQRPHQLSLDLILI